MYSVPATTSAIPTEMLRCAHFVTGTANTGSWGRRARTLDSRTCLTIPSQSSLQYLCLSGVSIFF